MEHSKKKSHAQYKDLRATYYVWNEYLQIEEVEIKCVTNNLNRIKEIRM
jgi:hypothetical protein